MHFLKFYLLDEVHIRKVVNPKYTNENFFMASQNRRGMFVEST